MEKISLNMLLASSQESRGFPGGASCKEPTCQCRRCKRHGFDPWVRKIPWRRKTATHSSIPAWEISWSEESGGLQSMGSQRVGHHWAVLRGCPPCPRGPWPWGVVTLMPAWPSGSLPRLQHSLNPSCHLSLPLTQPETWGSPSPHPRLEGTHLLSNSL